MLVGDGKEVERLTLKLYMRELSGVVVTLHCTDGPIVRFKAGYSTHWADPPKKLPSVLGVTPQASLDGR